MVTDDAAKVGAGGQYIDARPPVLHSSWDAVPPRAEPYSRAYCGTYVAKRAKGLAVQRMPGSDPSYLIRGLTRPSPLQASRGEIGVGYHQFGLDLEIWGLLFIYASTLPSSLVKAGGTEGGALGLVRQWSCHTLVTARQGISEEGKGCKRDRGPDPAQ